MTKKFYVTLFLLTSFCIINSKNTLHASTTAKSLAQLTTGYAQHLTRTALTALATTALTKRIQRLTSSEPTMSQKASRASRHETKELCRLDCIQYSNTATTKMTRNEHELQRMTAQIEQALHQHTITT